jgi:hypothetical protein
MRALVLLALPILVLGATGCREGVGSRCNETADCHAGLYCILPIGGSPQTGGVCTDISDLATELPDFSEITDDAGHDSGVDAATEDLVSLPDAADADGGVL